MAELLAWVDDISSASTLGRDYLKAQTVAGSKREPKTSPRITLLHQFLTQGRVHDVLEALFGEPPVLFKEKINYKHPGAARYAPIKMPRPTRLARCISRCCGLGFSGYKQWLLGIRQGAHHNGVIDVNADGCLPIERAAQLEWTPMPVAAGDAVFFNSLHRTAAAPTAPIVPRRALYVTYNASSEGDLRSEYYDHKKQALAEGRVSLINHFLGEDVS